MDNINLAIIGNQAFLLPEKLPEKITNNKILLRKIIEQMHRKDLILFTSTCIEFYNERFQDNLFSINALFWKTVPTDEQFFGHIIDVNKPLANNQAVKAPDMAAAQNCAVEDLINTRFVRKKNAPYLTDLVIYFSDQIGELNQLIDKLQKLTILPKIYIRITVEASFQAQIETFAKIPDLSKICELKIDCNGFLGVLNHIKMLRNLTTLCIKDDTLTSLPQDITTLTQLQTLALETPQLALLPEDIDLLQNLKWLTIISDELISIPDNITELKKLEVLGLVCRQLSGLPETMAQLRHLKYFHIMSDALAHWPSNLKNFTRLQTLKLGGSLFTKLPKGLETLLDLKELVLFVDPSIILPDSIATLKNLTALALHKNHASLFAPEENKYWAVPKGISNLPQLQEIEIDQFADLSQETGLWEALTQLTIYGSKENEPTFWRKLKQLITSGSIKKVRQFPSALITREQQGLLKITYEPND
jgi:Leucine-rich repeat (LRR) protein